MFIHGKYISKDTWYDADGKPFQPQVHYNVGGATKLYGAALYRLRPQDFGEHPPRRRHLAGVAARPTTTSSRGTREAEWLYQVHGNGGEDPTEGPRSKPYPWPAVSHEPRIQQLSDELEAGGYHPFHAPCGILLDEADRAAEHLHPLHAGATATRAWSTPRPTPRRSPCARCSTGPT